MKLISLVTNGKKAKVDDADYAALSKYRWWDCGGYPSTKVREVSQKGLEYLKTVPMHRLIMGRPEDPELRVDHINRNPLDNRRENLRWATRSENMSNSDYAEYMRKCVKQWRRIKKKST